MVNGIKAANLREALEYAASGEYIPYAGGTDLMLEDRPDDKFLFLGGVPEMRGISADSDTIRFGAACTFAEIAEHELTPPILRDAVLKIAAPAIRNLGTVGGNIANGSPKADSALIFMVANSRLRVASAGGEREVPLSGFYKGRKSLDLHPGELIVEILMPSHGLENYYYRKVGAREALAISRVSFAGIADIQNGVVSNLAVAFGAIADTILKRPEIDSMLIGKTPDEAAKLRDSYLAAWESEIQPIRGRISSEYRKDVCMNLLRDFLDTKLK